MKTEAIDKIHESEGRGGILSCDTTNVQQASAGQHKLSVAETVQTIAVKMEAKLPDDTLLPGSLDCSAVIVSESTTAGTKHGLDRVLCTTLAEGGLAVEQELHSLVPKDGQETHAIVEKTKPQSNGGAASSHSASFLVSNAVVLPSDGSVDITSGDDLCPIRDDHCCWNMQEPAATVGAMWMMGVHSEQVEIAYVSLCNYDIGGPDAATSTDQVDISMIEKGPSTKNEMAYTHSAKTWWGLKLGDKLPVAETVQTIAVKTEAKLPDDTLLPGSLDCSAVIVSESTTAGTKHGLDRVLCTTLAEGGLAVEQELHSLVPESTMQRRLLLHDETGDDNEFPLNSSRRQLEKKSNSINNKINNLKKSARVAVRRRNRPKPNGEGRRGNNCFSARPELVGAPSVELMPHMTTMDTELEEKFAHSEENLSLADSNVISHNAISRSGTVVASSSRSGGEPCPAVKKETSCEMHQRMWNKETKATTAMQMDDKATKLKMQPVISHNVLISRDFQTSSIATGKGVAWRWMCVFILLVGVCLPVVQANNPVATQALDSRTLTPPQWQAQPASSLLVESSARSLRAKGSLHGIYNATRTDMCAMARYTVASGYRAIVKQSIYERCGLDETNRESDDDQSASEHIVSDASHDEHDALSRAAKTKQTQEEEEGKTIVAFPSEAQLEEHAVTVDAKAKQEAEEVTARAAADEAQEAAARADASNATRRVLQSTYAMGAVLAFGGGVQFSARYSRYNQNYGQLGIGNINAQTSPVEVTALGTDNALVTAGTYHSLVLKITGEVFAFGHGGNHRSTEGSLGLETTTDQLSPVEVTALGNGNTLVAPGGRHSLVLKATGNVFAFGQASSGQLGLGNPDNLMLGLHGLRCQPIPVEVTALGAENALVAAGESHSLVLKATGVVYAFGLNNHGQLGIGSTDNQISPVEVTALGTNNALVVAGNYHSFVLKTTGAVHAFGYGEDGQLGLGNTNNQISPVEVTALGVENALVAAGHSHSLVLKTTGVVLTFGSGTFGQLGLDNTAQQDSPVEVTALGANNALAVVGQYHTLVLNTMGVVFAFGGGPQHQATTNGGQLGIGNQAQQDTPVEVTALGTDNVLIVAGGFHSFVLKGPTLYTVCDIFNLACGCFAGEYDHDNDMDTDCLACDDGKFSNPGATSCISCSLGTADTDSDPSTECEQCQPGLFSPAEATTCTHCAAGYIDHDSDPATPCNNTDIHLCPAGTHAAAGSTECTACAAGTADLDSNPATDCVNCTTGHFAAGGSTSCDPCSEGSADADLDSSTACAVCAVGEYSPQAATECIVCQSGTVDEDADPSTPCTDCAAGRADEDLDASTACAVCPNGTHAAPRSTVCDSCAPGRSDADSNPATACAACPRGQYNSLTGRIGSCDECFAGRYAPAFANVAVDDCEACSVGQYAANGSSACASCAPGTADEDNNPATPCSACQNGTYASCGGTECRFCAPGKSDSDLDATTPCVDCVPGQYWFNALDQELAIDQELALDSSTNNIAACVDCLAGQADTDGDSTTACDPCSDGEYAAAGSTTCDECAATGTADHDSDPSTPCIAVGGLCTQLCQQGTEDADCDSSTPCTDCTAGQFTEGGYYIEGQTQCRPCAPGSYAAPGSAPADCLGCPMGRADGDGNQWTPCQVCDPGTFTSNDANELVISNATQCANCAPGTFDDDANTSTACSMCAVGRANPAARSVTASACVPCETGRWSYLEGMPVCPVCQEGTYRGPDDLDGCLACDASQGCEPGSSYPLAAAGYFAELTSSESGDNTTEVVACVPFPYACLGTCSREVKAFILTRSSFSEDDEGLSLASCAPGLEAESCTDGYEGPRCSQCTQFRESFQDGSCDADADPPIVNGYYRLESRCIPCPCTWIKFHHMVVALFLAAVGFMFGLDVLGSNFAEHASTLAAPMLILVSFCQTIATFLDTGIPWPAVLRRMMVIFSGLNFNLELTRPECAGDFGAQKKVQVALAMPVFVGTAIAVYAFITVVRIQTEEDATAEQKHSARSQLKRKIASVATTLFTVGAIFFVKSFLRAFDCVASELDSSREYMASAPEIECHDEPGSEYSEIVRLSTIGLVSFGGCLVVIWLFLIKAHRSDNPGLGIFAFLADKFEDHFFFWEMVIVMRKVLLMAIFLLFDQVLAVLLATFLTIFSLCIHIAARPFEDVGTDWTEMLSLWAQLITLVAGPVFVILNDPESGMGPGTASRFRGVLELVGGITLAAALGMSLLVQVRVWRAVTSDGDEDEDDDFKIRTEERRRVEMEQALEEQEVIIAKLREARVVLRKEKADVEAMHDHAEVANPLQVGDEEGGDDDDEHQEA